ncbi:MAG: F0F1 ATP synthase subunit B [Alphaproteobacteria bacterium]|nr:F0F1 ATP synthase subunit B [Alphaproteobacteria bacterium]
MHIDWFTALAQALNFLVLMWLMKRFLYKPILNAIAAREKHISDQLANAADKESKAQKEQGAFKQKNDTFEKEKTKLMNEAQAEADAIHTKLLKKAEAEAEELRSKKKEALKTELDDLSADILKQTKEQVFALSSKVLGELADATLEERMVAVFIKRLHALNDKEKAAFASDSAIITSAFALPSAQQKALKAEIKSDTLKFKITPELVSGIELSANGHKLAWSVSDYLETLEKEAARAA